MSYLIPVSLLHVVLGSVVKMRILAQSSQMRQRCQFAEVGILDTPFDAALAAQARLVGEQAMQELQVRAAALLGVEHSGVELLGGHGDAQGGEVGENLLTQVWEYGRFRRLGLWRFLRTGCHRRLPRVRANADSRWSAVVRSDLPATTGPAFHDAGRRVHPGAAWAWHWLSRARR